jgi:hypothetical protein
LVDVVFIEEDALDTFRVWIDLKEYLKRGGHEKIETG